MTAPRLSDNPFAILGVSPRSRRSEINDAHQDALLDAETPDDERKLDMARQALFTPRDRLSAELAYLLGMRPSDARKALSFQSSTEFEQAAKNADGIAQANLLAEAASLATSKEGAREIVDQLLAAHEEIDEGDLHRTVEEERSVSGFGTVSRADLGSELKTITEQHAETAIAAFKRFDAPAAEVLRIIEVRCAANTLRQDRLAIALLAQYERSVSTTLENETSAISSLLDEYVEDLSGRGAFPEIERRLIDWDKVAQPLQRADEHLGADEAHSQRLYKVIRRAVLTLANERERPSDALRLSELAQNLFAELPTAAAQLATDVEALVSLEQDHRVASILMPLAAAVDAAEGNLSRTSATLARSGFTVNSPDPIGTIRRLYGEIVDNQREQNVIAGAVRIVRSLSIALHNEQEDCDGATIILDYLFLVVDRLPKELGAALRRDRNTLERTTASVRLAEALKSGRLKDAKLHCAILTESDDPEERARFIQIQRQIDEKISSARTSSFVTWGIIGLIAVVAIYSNSGSKADSAADEAAYASSEDAFVDEAAQTTDEQSSYPSEATATSDDGVETPPAPYSTASLSISELRYCLKQTERLEAARTAVSSYPQQNRFNSEVSDFNSRCGRFNYDQRDKSVVDGEIAVELDRLRQEGIELVGRAPSPTPITPPAQSFTPSNPGTPTFGDAVDALEESGADGQ
ncbi:hypothetical protein [Sphingopyxis macrogoltabida]|nr:hypothetical protein [Sphingopyxis macrogoltabida]